MEFLLRPIVVITIDDSIGVHTRLVEDHVDYLIEEATDVIQLPNYPRQDEMACFKVQPKLPQTSLSQNLLGACWNKTAHQKNIEV